MFRQMIKPEDIYKIKSDPTYYLGYYPEKYWDWDACMEIMALFDNPKSFFFGNNDGEFRWNILKEHLGSIREVLLMPGMYPRLQGLGQNYYEIDNMEYSTDDDVPYKKAEWTVITNCIELQAMKDNSSGKYYLDRDIDCTFCTQNPGGALYNGGAGFEPVRLNDGGEFDGDGFTITGLKVNRPLENGVGLFRYLYSGAKVRNLTLQNCIIIGKNGGALTSAISSDTQITNCHSSGSVTVSNPTMSIDGGAGGLIGHSFGGSIVECSSSCSVTDTSGAGIAGGLVSYNQGSVVNSHSSGFVTGYNKGGFASWGISGYSNCTWSIASSGCAHALSFRAPDPDPPGIVGV